MEIGNRKTSRYNTSTELTSKEISSPIHQNPESRKLEEKTNEYWKYRYWWILRTEFCPKSWIPYTNISGFSLRSSSLRCSGSVMAASWKTNKVSTIIRIARSLHFWWKFGICDAANHPKRGEKTLMFSLFPDPGCEPPYKWPMLWIWWVLFTKGITLISGFWSIGSHFGGNWWGSELL